MGDPLSHGDAFDVQVGKISGAPRILLLTYHFPPANTAGTLRWQKLSALAGEQGWEVDVCCGAPSEFAVLDRSRLDDLPSGTRIRYVVSPTTAMQRVDDFGQRALQWVRGAARAKPSPDPAASAPGGSAGGNAGSLAPDEIRFRWLERRSWRRAYNALVEISALRGWAREATRAATAFAGPGSHRVVITCGPPHWIHDAARSVAARMRAPLVMDLRDPWALRGRMSEFHASPLLLIASERAERRAVRAASLLVTNTEPVRAAMARLYAGKTIITVLNGFDDEPVPSTARSDVFSLRYAGDIYLDRDPTLLLRAARLVIDRHSLGPDEFRIEMMGHVTEFGDRTLRSIAEEERVDAYLTIRPARPRAEALEFMAGASMLVSLPQDSAWAIPSKLFEYMRFPVWLLALTVPGSAIDSLLRGTAADVSAPSDVETIAAILERRFQEHRSGTHPVPLAEAHPEFSRRAQSRTLFDRLGGLEGPRR